ncbi:trypsin-like peptidase domain-containing protein [Streptomyces sp. NPDC053367]|uniref:trypsin-like peptidase domain-containing protein n=1 Tax=Streptomyces sp. NPDC053367 TaxID=3365700 RepID=UPI0037D49D0D
MTANADRGVRPERAAEIIAATADGRTRRRGSGYLVAPGRVLTAAHVVEGTDNAQVRFDADRPGERTAEATVTWRHAGIDVAVLTLPGAPDTPAVPFGRVGEQDTVLRCTALGFPRFKLRTDADGSRFRDAEHIHAACAALSNRREGTLDLAVSAPPVDDPEPGRDPWEGMSGAAVFSGGHLIGLVTSHHRTDGPGRITATRVDRWAEHIGDSALSALQEHAGVRLTALPDVVRPDGPDHVRRMHRARLEDDFAPKQLDGRQAELRELTAFCGGSAPYLWIQGRPWAGKTALVAWFALHPPRGVVPVWFFVTARDARQSDAEACTGALVEQLAAVAGREPSRTGTHAARDGERRLLLREAAERVGHDGKTLLLLVDGLDEDEFLTPGAPGPSIASLLPERLPPNVRVLVTSRPGPGLPADVRGTHPLRHCRVMPLSSTMAARHLEADARFELDRILAGDDDLQRDLVGLLTAARGTLRRDDLRALTGAPGHAVGRRLGSTFGRILRERGAGGDDSDGDATLYVSPRGYLFAHETLLAAAQDALGADLTVYWERLHAWAKAYEERGWPADTPPYLLQPYGRLLALLHDTGRATTLATDPRRRDRLREATGSDAACLAEITAARDVVRRTSPHDLAALAALAMTEDLVARRNAALHPDIPAVHARLGRVRQSIGLAHSVLRPLERAWALSAVALVLAEAGDERAIGPAEEAVRLCRLAVVEEGVHLDVQVPAAQGRLATVLALLGREDEATKLIAELSGFDFLADVGVLIEALLSTAAALGGPSAAGLVRQAEDAAGTLMELSERLRALASVAACWTALGEPGEAARVLDSVVMLVHFDHEGSVHGCLSAAEALRPTRPREADHLTRTAYARATERLGPPDSLEDGYEWYTAADLALALAVDSPAEAQSCAESVENTAGFRPGSHWREVWRAVAEGHARRGRVRRAWAAAEKAWPADDAEELTGRWPAHLCGLLVRTAGADEVEAFLLTQDVSRRPVTQVLAALAARVAQQQPERAHRLLRAVEQAQASARVPQLRHDRVTALAVALASVGRTDDVERLLALPAPGGTRLHRLALVASAMARTDRPGALSLAERAAAEMASDPDGAPLMLPTVVSALARTGATGRVLELVGPGRQGTAVERARPAAVAGLQPHDPASAGLLADLVPADSGRPEVLAELLAALGPDDARGAALRSRLEGGLRKPTFHDELLIALVTCNGDRARIRRSYSRAVARHSEWWPVRPGTVEALVLAVAGDLDEARAVAARSSAREEERAEAHSRLAAYVARVPGPPVDLAFTGLSLDNLPAVQQIASTLLPPPDGPDLPLARTLLAEALGGPAGVHHALPVLAALDPDAVTRVRGIVFAHLGLVGPR